MTFEVLSNSMILWRYNSATIILSNPMKFAYKALDSNPR